MLESNKKRTKVLFEETDILLGPGDRAFEPHYSDQNPSEIVDFRGIFLFFVYCGAGGEPVILNIFFVKFRLVCISMMGLPVK